VEQAVAERSVAPMFGYAEFTSGSSAAWEKDRPQAGSALKTHRAGGK